MPIFKLLFFQCLPIWVGLLRGKIPLLACHGRFTIITLEVVHVLSQFRIYKRMSASSAACPSPVVEVLVFDLSFLFKFDPGTIKCETVRVSFQLEESVFVVVRLPTFKELTGVFVCGVECIISSFRKTFFWSAQVRSECCVWYNICKSVCSCRSLFALCCFA